MTLPAANNTITLLQIRNEAYAQTTPNPTNYGTANSDLMNFGFYRNKYYWNGSSYVQFPNTAAPISIHDFHGKAFNCACDCACACNCGDGTGDSGGGGE